MRDRVESLVGDSRGMWIMTFHSACLRILRSNADRLRDKLIAEGFPALTVLRDGLYKVQVGAFRNLENAIRMEQVLRGKGYSTFISST